MKIMCNTQNITVLLLFNLLLILVHLENTQFGFKNSKFIRNCKIAYYFVKSPNISFAVTDPKSVISNYVDRGSSAGLLV